MPEIAVNALPPELRQLALRAETARTQQAWDYVLEVTGQILRQQPGCLAMRRLQHEARRQQLDDGQPWWRSIRAMRAWLRSGFNRRGPDRSAAAWARIDAMLAVDPTNRAGLSRLAALATAMDLPATAVFAWQCRVEDSPGDRDAGLELARACVRAGWNDQALAALENVLRHHPHDAAAQALRRDVSVAQTMASGDWQADGSVREPRRGP